MTPEASGLLIVLIVSRAILGQMLLRHGIVSSPPPPLPQKL